MQRPTYRGASALHRDECIPPPLELGHIPARGKERLRSRFRRCDVGFGEMLANGWATLGQFMYPKPKQATAY
jgi:hypothetical protein